VLSSLKRSLPNADLIMSAALAHLYCCPSHVCNDAAQQSVVEWEAAQLALAVSSLLICARDQEWTWTKHDVQGCPPNPERRSMRSALVPITQCTDDSSETGGFGMR
jgi:hypothetical protein